jgi:hypothetical protein
MKTNFAVSTRKSVLRFAGRIVADAALGATCGGLYGFVFGGIGALAQHESHRLIAITGVFALCGAIAGIALGTYSAFSNADNPSASSSASVSKVVTQEKTREEAPPVTAIRSRSLAAANYRRPQSSRVAV